MKMLLCYFLLSLGLYQAAILRSKHLQMDLSYKFPTLKDLLKTQLVDKNWVGVEKGFTKISPKAGLFESKETNKIIFETRKFSWHQNKIVGTLKDCPEFQTLIEEQNWNEVFFELIFANQFYELQGAQEFLKALAEIVDVNIGHCVGGFKSTAIHAAIFWICDTDLLEILLKRPEINPNIKDEFGRTALHNVAQEYNIDDVEVIQILLNHGAEINAADSNLMTPLMIASETGNFDVVKTLLAHDASPNWRDKEDKTALHYATKGIGYDRAAFIEILLNNGAEVETRDRKLKAQLKQMGMATKRKRKSK